MELATALQLSGAIRRIDGTRIDLATLVVCFPELSTSVSTTRSSAAIRSSTELRLTHFLDILRNNLIAYSQR